MRFLALPLTLGLAVFGTDLSGSDKKSRRSPSRRTRPWRCRPPASSCPPISTAAPTTTKTSIAPAIEWEWGDDTRSNNSADCDPYEAGKSEIKRRFTADHTYRISGEYRIQFRLKKKDKPIAAASTSVKIRPGLGDPGGDR